MRAHAVRMSFRQSRAQALRMSFWQSRDQPSSRVFWKSQAAACSPGLLALDAAFGAPLAPYSQPPATPAPADQPPGGLDEERRHRHAAQGAAGLYFPPA